MFHSALKNRRFVPLPVRRAEIQHLFRGNDQLKAADVFGIGVAAVNRTWRRFLLTSKCKRSPRGGGMRPAVSPAETTALRRLVE